MNPAHAAAYFASPVAVRTAIQRGRVDAANRPHAFTFQAHPEFCTPTGRECLATLMREWDAPSRGEAWLAERLASMESPASDEGARKVMSAVVRSLWPAALP